MNRFEFEKKLTTLSDYILSSLSEHIVLMESKLNKRDVELLLKQLSGEKKGTKLGRAIGAIKKSKVFTDVFSFIKNNRTSAHNLLKDSMGVIVKDAETAAGGKDVAEPFIKIIKNTANDKTSTVQQLAFLKTIPFLIQRGYAPSDVTKILNSPSFKEADSALTTYEELLYAWTKDGKPNDIQDLTKLLIDSGYTKDTIDAAIKSIGIDKSTGTDARVEKLYTIISSNNLEPYVLDYIKKNKLVESQCLLEDQISDRHVKRILVRLLSLADNKDSRQGAEKSYRDTMRTFVKKWKRDLKRVDVPLEIPVGTKTTHNGEVYIWKGKQWVSQKGRIAKKEVGNSMSSDVMAELNEPKIRLIKEIVNFLADRKSIVGWKDMVGEVEAAISNAKLNDAQKRASIDALRSGDFLESAVYPLIDEFILECGFTWENLGISVSDEKVGEIISGKIVLENVFNHIVNKVNWGK